MDYKFKHAILGGTFDRFHAGHAHFVGSACSVSEKITIGLATAELYKDKFLSGIIEPYEIRKRGLEDFLKEKDYLSRTTIIPIDDFYGNTLDNEDADTLFVTEHGQHNAEIINLERQKRNLTTFEIKVVEYLKADDGENISSSRIRAGEINRSGFVYASLFTQTRVLPENMREEVKVLGEVVPHFQDLKQKINDSTFIVAVGDIVTENFITAGRLPQLGIVDLRSERQPIKDGHGFDITFEAENTAGKINSQAVLALKNALDRNFDSKTPQIVKINGEEDLLALPAILLSPLGAKVLYGLFPDKGVVVVDINETKKEEIRKTVEKLPQKSQ